MKQGAYGAYSAKGAYSARVRTVHRCVQCTGAYSAQVHRVPIAHVFDGVSRNFNVDGVARNFSSAKCQERTT